jgi:hypothetical protein
MAQNVPQTYQNHARFYPLYHFIAIPLLAINFFYALYRLVTALSGYTVVAFLTATGLLAVGLASRIMALSVQDRVIRLEERLRMREVLPADLQARIGEFTRKQLVALRFASDAELPALARKVLDDKLTDQKVIKQLVTNWRADDLRA